MHKLIRASAGSGKTYQLSGHFLKQLLGGQSPESILATTFTRKAAGEILGRVLTRLADAAGDEQRCRELTESLNVSADRRQVLQVLVDVTSQLHRMRICTLDSFFQQVARSLTLELGLPPGWSIVDEHVERQLRTEAIDAVLAQQMPKDSQRLMQMLARGRSKRSVRDLIDDTIRNFHDLYLRSPQEAWHRIETPPLLTRAQVEEARRSVAAVTPYDEKSVVGAVRKDMDQFDRELWDQFLKDGIAKKVFTGDLTYRRKPICGELAAAYEPLVQQAKAELLRVVAHQTKATWHLLDRFDREYTRLRSEHGWLGFGDVTRTLARAHEATSNDRIAFRLDSQLSHLLLDEFQDTSPDQWNILKRLAERVATGDESTFFCVGDPKQAIYGWRGGVAEILDVVADTVPDLKIQSQDESRRSSVAVIETCNKVFQHLTQHGDLQDFDDACRQWQNGFPEHSTFHQERPGHVTLKSSPDFGDLTTAERKPIFHAWVARQIRELHEQSPGAVIGVLTEKNESVARLVHQLILAGVPASEEGGTPPTDSPAVLAILSLLHMASHPGCEISRYHVATSPLGPVVGFTSWSNHQSAVLVATNIRQQLMNDGYGKTLQGLFQEVEPACNERDIVRLRQIVAEGWKFDDEPSLNPVDFVMMLEQSRLSRSDAAAVRVMTVHQSKGLEFDIVVLPELDRQLFQQPSAAVRLSGPVEPPDHVCVWRSKLIRQMLPPQLQEAFQDTTSRYVSERLCLLYVALTRAEHALHMFLPTGSRGLRSKSSAALLLAALTGERECPPNEVLYETGQADWHLAEPKLQQATANIVKKAEETQPITLAPMTARRRGLRRQTPSHHTESRLRLRYADADSKSTTSAPDPRVRGTILHSWFEEIEWLDAGQYPDTDNLKELAQQHFANEAQTDEMLKEFDHWLHNQELRDLLTQSGTMERDVFLAQKVEAAELVVHNERPFVIRHQGAVVQGTIDRLVLAVRNGRTVAAEVIDYKTDACRTEDVPAWVQQKSQHYLPQLELYRTAVNQCFNVPETNIRCRLSLLEAGVTFTAAASAKVSSAQA